MFVTFINFFFFFSHKSTLTTIEILVLSSWIPASKEFLEENMDKNLKCLLYPANPKCYTCFEMNSFPIINYLWIISFMIMIIIIFFMIKIIIATALYISEMKPWIECILDIMHKWTDWEAIWNFKIHLSLKNKFKTLQNHITTKSNHIRLRFEKWFLYFT